MRELALELANIRGFKKLSGPVRASIAWVHVLRKREATEAVVHQAIAKMVKLIEAEKVEGIHAIDLLDIWKTLLNVKPEIMALMLPPLKRHYVLFVGNLLEDIIKLLNIHEDLVKVERGRFVRFATDNKMQDQEIFAHTGSLIPVMTDTELMETLIEGQRELGEIKKSICNFC